MSFINDKEFGWQRNLSRNKEFFSNTFFFQRKFVFKATCVVFVWLVFNETFRVYQKNSFNVFFPCIKYRKPNNSKLRRKLKINIFNEKKFETQVENYSPYTYIYIHTNLVVNNYSSNISKPTVRNPSKKRKKCMPATNTCRQHVHCLMKWPQTMCQQMQPIRPRRHQRPRPNRHRSRQVWRTCVQRMRPTRSIRYWRQPPKRSVLSRSAIIVPNRRRRLMNQSNCMAFRWRPDPRPTTSNTTAMAYISHTTISSTCLLLTMRATRRQQPRTRSTTMTWRSAPISVKQQSTSIRPWLMAMIRPRTNSNHPPKIWSSIRNGSILTQEKWISLFSFCLLSISWIMRIVIALLVSRTGRKQNKKK